MPTKSGDQIVETTTEARQGVTGHNVRYVLFASIALVVVAFVAIYLAFIPHAPT